MSPEALARLRESLDHPFYREGKATDVRTDDLRALLDAYDNARAEGVAAERARVVALVRAEAKRLRAELGLPTEGLGLRGDALWQLADRIEEGT